MRIAYVTHTRFPTEKAHGHQVAQVCSALAALGHTVTLVVPDVQTGVRQDAFAYYGLPKNFSIEKIHAFDALHHPLVPGALAFLLSMRSYRKSLRNILSKRRFDLLYARSPVILPTLVESGMPVIIELHTLPRRGKSGFVKWCNRCKRVVCLTTPMRDALVGWGVAKKKTMIEGDAVDLARFAKPLAKSAAKKHHRLPADSVVVGYVGSLVTFDRLQKGVDLLVRALARMKKQHVPVFGFIVGGPVKWSERYRKLGYSLGLTHHEVQFHVALPSKQVPSALAACDILVYPAPASKHPYFRRDTSPLKLFEYMAAGVPVVCADIPPVRDVVDATMVRFAEPGSLASIAGGIKHILEKPKEAAARAKKAKEAMKEYTWEKRMKRILAGLSS
ncbi:glycosyltransferase family 4 protein [Candidatus Peregrinibacteria bacterium]|nr:glycosyltransferase family 4 protein [Candidatus Peregrinibacteria bacterium]